LETLAAKGLRLVTEEQEAAEEQGLLEMTELMVHQEMVELAEQDLILIHRGQPLHHQAHQDIFLVAAEVERKLQIQRLQQEAQAGVARERQTVTEMQFQAAQPQQAGAAGALAQVAQQDTTVLLEDQVLF
jgi:hypothetical protein